MPSSMHPAVTCTAPALVNENVSPAPAVSHAAPAPVIEYAAEPAVTYTAPAPVNENVAPAPAVTSAIRAWLIEHAAAPAISFAAPDPMIEYPALDALVKKYRALAPASQRKSLMESELELELTKLIQEAYRILETGPWRAGSLG